MGTGGTIILAEALKTHSGYCAVDLKQFMSCMHTLRM